MNKSFQVSYILRYDKADENNLIPIYLRFTVDGVKSEISLKRKIHKDNWDSKRNEPKILSHELNQLCLYLNTQRNAIYEAYSQLIIDKKSVTVKRLRDKLFGLDELNSTLIQLADSHNKEFESLIGIKYSYGSYKNYKTSLVYLKEFVVKIYKRRDLNLFDLDYQFAEKYFKFLTIEKPCNHNGATKHLQRLKKILNYGVRIGVIDKNPFNSFQLSFKSFSRKILNWNDLFRLYTCELPTESLRDVRDIFIFQSFTGLSYIDVKNLSKENIITGVDGELWITILRHKTQTRSSIPLLAQAQYIIEKHIDYHERLVMPVISNQKMNSYLKEIGKLLKFNIPLSSHVARHTFATTVTLSNNVPIETVSKMLGHTNLKTTQIYARVIDSKVSNDMMNLRKVLEKK